MTEPTELQFQKLIEMVTAMLSSEPRGIAMILLNAGAVTIDYQNRDLVAVDICGRKVGDFPRQWFDDENDHRLPMRLPGAESIPDHLPDDFPNPQNDD